MAHEWTPTYPKMKYSFIDGIMVTTMDLFNKREDISWYEIGVYDKDFNLIKHSVQGGKVQYVPPLQRKSVDVYIRSKDMDKATYICSKSKIISESEKATVVASRICSKIK